jgi:cytochrome c oxidase assembly protein subunit 15
MAGVVMGMVALGGYVRLEKAGLSMVKWDLSRVKAPSSRQEWEYEFEEYKANCPQYSNDFPNMNLDEFIYIYKLEHYHRQLGKVLGLVFAVPFVTFLALGYLRKKIIITSLVACGLGGCQGLVGWWMVKSGLKDNLGDGYKKNNVRVSQYRLAFHFTMSVFIYSILLRTGLFLVSKPQILKAGFEYMQSNTIIRKKLLVSFHLAFATLIWGAFMAGTDSGKITNNFPKMGDIWYPGKEHFYMRPVWRNFFENEFIIHFTHRALAITTFCVLFSKIIIK